MYSVAISTKVYLDRNKEIDSWLQETNAVTRGSIIHPVSNYYNPNPKVIITFEDPDLASMFRLMWG